MDGTIYRRFCEVLVRVGLCLQPSDVVVIQAPPEECELVRIAAAQCYAAGAKFVLADYDDSVLMQVRMEHAKPDTLAFCPAWLTEYRRAYGADRICFLALQYPSFLCAGNGAALAAVRQSAATANAGFAASTADGTVSICKTVVPNVAWAERVFPKLSGKAALSALWTQYAHICRLDCENPVAAWRAQQAAIAEKKRVLNALALSELHIQSDVTDLRVGLVQGGGWIGGCAYNQRTGLAFVPNIPTEEVFSVPDRLRVTGYVGASLPLNYDGELIENIRLTVQDGCVTDYTATSGLSALRSILETDEGARYFGEVSLVPVTSPIYQTGLVYYTTLLDENAACHMALGNATPGVLPDGYTLSRGELLRRGVNRSSLHVDFMIGSERMDIDGLGPEGDSTSIMRGGNWAI